MMLDPYDALDQLEEFLGSMLTWCDQNGERDTGAISVSAETVVRVRRVVSAVYDALSDGKLIRFPPGFDCMAYLTFDGCESLEVV